MTVKELEFMKSVNLVGEFLMESDRHVKFTYVDGKEYVLCTLPVDIHERLPELIKE